MFVYQNKEGQICVTFADNKPVKDPEYVIAIDEDAEALYMVSGVIAPMPEEDVEDAPSDNVGGEGNEPTGGDEPTGDGNEPNGDGNETDGNGDEPNGDAGEDTPADDGKPSDTVTE